MSACSYSYALRASALQFLLVEESASLLVPFAFLDASHIVGIRHHGLSFGRAVLDVPASLAFLLFNELLHSLYRFFVHVFSCQDSSSSSLLHPLYVQIVKK